MPAAPSVFRNALPFYPLVSLLAIAVAGCGPSPDGANRTAGPTGPTDRADAASLDDAGTDGRSDGGTNDPVDGGTGKPIDGGTDSASDAAADGPITTATETLVLSVLADAYVNESDPTTNYGAAKELLVDTAPERYETLLKFALPPLRNEVRSATLRVYATDGSGNGPKVFPTTDPWNETEVTWDNRPQTSGAAVSDVGVVQTGWVEVDVTDALRSSGEVSFLLQPDSQDGIEFESREAGHTPELVVVTEARPCDGSPQPLAQVGMSCCTAAELACAGHAQKVVLVCDGNLTWSVLRTCSGDTLCDSRAGTQQGTCQPPVPDCIGKQPGDTVCREQELLQCGPDLVTSEQTACPFACSGGECTGTCVPGQRQCQGGTPRVCGIDGTWAPEAKCPYVCTGAGVCTGECVPGEKTCAGPTPRTCDAQGKWVDEAVCPQVCVAGKCELACPTGEKQCNGLVPQTCLDTGVWMDGLACDYACIAGVCAGECAPSSKQCEGLVPQMCDAQGHWQSGAACPYVCQAGACTGVCVPESGDCQGLVPRTCSASGYWQPGVACPYVCSAGDCTGVCTPGSKQCNGEMPSTCDASGQWADGTACQYGCEEGECIEVCVPGSQDCQGLVPRACNESGRWQNGVTCPFVCTDGICAGDCSEAPEGSCVFVSEYQAEGLSDSYKCSISTSNAFFTGTGFVDFSGVGAWMEWNNVVIAEAGAYRVSFRYAVGMGADRRCNIIVDGAKVGEVLFPNTGLWTTWKTDSITLNLSAGFHTIRVHAASSPGPNLDRMNIVPQ